MPSSSSICKTDGCSSPSYGLSSEECVKKTYPGEHTHHSKCVSNKVENPIIRCTEITCLYSSTDEVSKHPVSHEADPTFTKCDASLKPSEWTKVVNATLGEDKDIVLEVDNGDSSYGLQDVHAVELVVAVQSAIKQRQELIEEWKNKTLYLTDQLEKIQHEKHVLERSNLSKDSELECLARRLQELHKQYKKLSHDSHKLRKELECLRRDYSGLTEAYNLTIYELKETKCKLAEAIEASQKLENRLKKQLKDNDCLEKDKNTLTSELEESRRHIKHLTCSLEETTKELLVVKHTLEEYKHIEMKLKNLHYQYKSLKEKHDNIDACLNQAFEENASLKEIISKLNLTIEGLTSDRNELVLAVQCLNNEKNVINTRNIKLTKELKCAKHKFEKTQSELRSVQSDVECLMMKIEELENFNKNLTGELNVARGENVNLNDNLRTTVGECKTLSHALAEAQCQLEVQQRSLTEVGHKVKRLFTEKQHLENTITNIREDQKNSSVEINRLNCENSSIRNQNSELISSLNQVTIELNEALTEIKHLTREIEQLRHTIQTERDKHESHVKKLQEKIRIKSAEWKEYVTNEVTRLRNKRRADIKKYLDINRQLEERLQNNQEHRKTVEEELNACIMELKKELECYRLKLEETVNLATSEKNELMENFTAEINRLAELLEKQKMESQWLTTELESRIQGLVQKSLDDDATIHMLSTENCCIKEKFAKISDEYNQLMSCHIDLKGLLETKHALECEVANCKGLLALAEETNYKLQQENTSLQKRVASEEESGKNLHQKVVKLKRIIGKKDAQIEVLQNTIQQLKDHVSHVTNENTSLKNSLKELECKYDHMCDKIRNLNQELTDAKRALDVAGEEKLELTRIIKTIEGEINKLEYENSCLKNELQVAKENTFLTEKAMENSHHVQIELKERVQKAELAASRSGQEAKTLENKVIRMQENVKKIEADFKTLEKTYQYNDEHQKKKIESLQTQLSSSNEEISALRNQLESSEGRINRLRESLRESEKSFHGLVVIFDSLRETLCHVLCLEYVPLSGDASHDLKLDDSKRHIDRSNLLRSYKCEVEVYSKHLYELKNNETELVCKLANTKKDFEKLSLIMKELQCEYTQKVEKLYRSVKEKDEQIKYLEKQMVHVQLEAAEVDEVMASTLRNKMNEQQCYIEKLQGEKAILQSEILCLAKKVNEMESQLFELNEKLKCIDQKNSKLQVKNVSLEGDLEKLTLLLKEARDKEHEQLSQYKQMLLANRELMEKVRTLKCELQRCDRESDDLPTKQCCDPRCCIPSRCSTHEKEMEMEIKMLSEKLANSQRAEHEARHALGELDENLCSITKQLAAAQTEKANLEGWVSHLQQLVSGGYVADSALPQQLGKVQEEKCALEQTVETLKSNMSNIQEEKQHLKNTVHHLRNCNSNLEDTIMTISKTKEKLEKELSLIQKKVDSLCHGVKSSDSDLTSCARDISKLLSNACTISKALHRDEPLTTSEKGDRRITAGIKTYASVYRTTSDESTSVSVATQTLCQSEVPTECCVKPYAPTDNSSTQTSNICHDCHYMDLKHSDISDIKTCKAESVRKPHKSPKKSLRHSKESVSSKSSKTFV